MAENSDMKTIKLNRETIQMIVIDTINIYTREVLKARNLLNENFEIFFDEDFDDVKYGIAESISNRYKEIQIAED